MQKSLGKPQLKTANISAKHVLSNVEGTQRLVISTGGRNLSTGGRNLSSLLPVTWRLGGSKTPSKNFTAKNAMHAKIANRYAERK